MKTTKDPRLAPQPNLFELSSEGVSITYSTSAIDGRPQLGYAAGERCYVFRGDEIRVAYSEIGRQVSVTLEATPDLETTSLTLLLPPVNLDGHEAPIRTLAIVTRHRTSVGGPDLVKGQVLDYRPLELAGFARMVVF